MAKTLAAARKQLDGATKQIQGITKELQTGLDGGNLNIDAISNALIGTAATTSGDSQAPAATTAVAGAAAAGTPKKSADQLLIEMARNLNVSTLGKTREEISQAIMDALAIKPNSAAPAQAPAAEKPQPAGSETAPPPAAPENQAKTDSQPPP